MAASRRRRHQRVACLEDQIHHPPATEGTKGIRRPQFRDQRLGARAMGKGSFLGLHCNQDKGTLQCFILLTECNVSFFPQVNHSHSLNKPPVNSWVLCKSDGELPRTVPAWLGTARHAPMSRRCFFTLSTTCACSKSVLAQTAPTRGCRRTSGKWM